MRAENEALLAVIQATKLSIGSQLGEMDLTETTGNGKVCRQLIAVIYAIEDIVLDRLVSTHNITKH